ncbi:hypothetical protein PR048_024623 [Dryococelus australis]|uniref:Uncharacterized protein n=1 Tax=Dryococelus australis TaxID=614101 RepID=A0ABQ9GP70_9NEOP|nr:hypothetical protein PR048_024623 [Dryococelus australis]
MPSVVVLHSDGGREHLPLMWLSSLCPLGGEPAQCMGRGREESRPILGIATCLQLDLTQKKHVDEVKEELKYEPYQSFRTLIQVYQLSCRQTTQTVLLIVRYCRRDVLSCLCSRACPSLSVNSKQYYLHASSFIITFMGTPRLRKITLNLGTYDINVLYVRRSQMYIADAFSRAPFT